ncbi:hypothetical protein HPB51_005383 [Rhipicephalus microplus]|uniref:Uncharacterized protein n=1 Tax=Rhipicephalus microplus TaxID=6941 RepID=A0A9J6DFY1_RHIMP|nr:hypothetical protein HPB51_005383 [Rhipicephalus microplus]
MRVLQRPLHRGCGDILRHCAFDKTTGYKNEQAYRHTRSKIANMNTSDRGGLPASIFLNVGNLYIFTANIDVSDGLLNEKMGALRYVKHDEHANIVRLWLEFPTSAEGIIARAKIKQVMVANPIIQSQLVSMGLRTTTNTIYARH